MIQNRHFALEVLSLFEIGGCVFYLYSSLCLALVPHEAQKMTIQCLCRSPWAAPDVAQSYPLPSQSQRSPVPKLSCSERIIGGVLGAHKQLEIFRARTGRAPKGPNVFNTQDVFKVFVIKNDVFEPFLHRPDELLSDNSAHFPLL